MNATLALLQPDEVQEALWMVSVLERSGMPALAADQWRRRNLGVEITDQPVRAS